MNDNLLPTPDAQARQWAMLCHFAAFFGLVFPFGLMAIALRFLLRALMTASGHLSADPNEAHKEELRGGENEHSVAAGGEGGV